MQATSVPHMCSLHTCILLVFLICSACIHVYYYSTAYTLASHNNIHLSINPMYLNVAVLLISECQLHCFILEDLILCFHVCCIKHATTHMRSHEVCRIHACTMQHTYCIYMYICYLAAHIRHVYSIQRSYLHMLHMYAAHTIHPYCMCAAYTQIGSAPNACHTSM